MSDKEKNMKTYATFQYEDTKLPRKSSEAESVLEAKNLVALWLRVGFGFLFLFFFVGSALAEGLKKAEMVDILKGIDQRIKSPGDYKALVYIEQKEKDKPDVARDALVYRRDLDQKLMILFTKPKTEAG